MNRNLYEKNGLQVITVLWAVSCIVDLERSAYVSPDLAVWRSFMPVWLAMRYMRTLSFVTEILHSLQFQPGTMLKLLQSIEPYMFACHDRSMAVGDALWLRGILAQTCSSVKVHSVSVASLFSSRDLRACRSYSRIRPPSSLPFGRMLSMLFTITTSWHFFRFFRRHLMSMNLYMESNDLGPND